MSSKPPKTVKCVTPGRRVAPHSVAPLADRTTVNHAIQQCWETFREAVCTKPDGRVVILLSEESMQHMWMDHLMRWSYYYDPVLLEGISRKLIRGQRLPQKQLEYLKQLKNMGDNLRNFFQLFSVNHQVPKLIHSLVKMVGQLRDQVRLGEWQRAGKQARQLLAFLPGSGKVDWPELHVDPEAKCAFLHDRIIGMKRLLARKKLTAFDVHQIKKDFRLVYSVYYYLYPDQASVSASQNALSAAKKIVKKMHQILLVHKYQNQAKYRDTLVELPEEFRAHLLESLKSIKIKVVLPQNCPD